MTQTDLGPIDRKLSIIVRLLARSVLAAQLTPDASQKEQIALLSSADLNASEIAGILGTTLNTVRVTLSQLKKEHK